MRRIHHDHANARQEHCAIAVNRFVRCKLAIEAQRTEKPCDGVISAFKACWRCDSHRNAAVGEKCVKCFKNTFGFDEDPGDCYARLDSDFKLLRCSDFRNALTQ